MARLVDGRSAPCAPSSICLFETPPSQVAFQRGTWLTFTPTNPIDNSGPYTFNIMDSAHFLNLSKTWVSFRLKIKRPPKKEGETVGDNVALTNAIGLTFFNQVKLSFNNVQVYDSTYYGYKSYIHTLLNHNSDFKSSILSAGGWIEDDDSPINDSKEDGGYIRRMKMIKGDEVDICAPLMLEPFESEKLRIPHINMQLTLYRHSDAFILESHEDTPPAVSVEICDLRLHIRAVEVNATAALNIEKSLRTNMARYPYTITRAKVLHIPEGRIDLPYSVLYHDIIPRRLIIGLIEPDAMEGNIRKNSLCFKPFDVSEIQVDAGGTIYPSQPIRCEFSQKNYARMFVNLFEELGAVSENRCPNISYRKYIHGSCFFAVNLSPTDVSNTWELIKSGCTQLSIKFDRKTPVGGLNVLVLSQFDGMISIDNYRNVFSENHA